jgi:hypothetical protein
MGIFTVGSGLFFRVASTWARISSPRVMLSCNLFELSLAMLLIPLALQLELQAHFERFDPKADNA